MCIGFSGINSDFLGFYIVYRRRQMIKKLWLKWPENVIPVAWHPWFVHVFSTDFGKWVSFMTNPSVSIRWNTYIEESQTLNFIHYMFKSHECWILSPKLMMGLLCIKKTCPLYLSLSSDDFRVNLEVTKSPMLILILTLLILPMRKRQEIRKSQRIIVMMRTKTPMKMQRRRRTRKLMKMAMMRNQKFLMVKKMKKTIWKHKRMVTKKAQTNRIRPQKRFINQYIHLGL